MKKVISLLVFGFLCLQLQPLLAQNANDKKGQENGIKLSAPIPTADKVRIGTFDNGLTYYIRHNEKPQDMLQLRLVVNVGSLQENPNQLGLAHVMEHMNFNGTKYFKENELVDYLQSIGLQFGADLNAYTTFGHTVFILPLPTDESDELTKGFQVLEDWAHNALLNHKMIDTERGVILEEYRSGLGAARRMRMEYLPKILKGSRYAKRPVIGTKESIKTFDYSALENFYQTWYRPGLMAVVAVGDMPVDKIYKKIKKHFANIPTNENPQKLKTYSIPNHEKTYVAIASDKEAAFARVQLIYMDKGTRKVPQTIGDYRSELVERLFTIMINNRLAKLSNSSTPPFISASSSHGMYWSPQKAAYRSGAITPAKGRLEGLKALLIANKKVKVYGFEPIELKRAKKELLASLKAVYKGRKTRSSASYVGQYISNFLHGAPIPGIAWRYKTAKKLIPTIGLSEVSSLIDEYLHKDNRTVLITGPVKEDPITEQEVRNLLATVANMQVKPYHATKVRDQLMREMPKRGSIIKTSTNEKLGTTTLILGNGVKVVYKKTDFKDNQILMRAFDYGGSSLFSSDVLHQVAFAMGGLTKAGIAGLSTTELNHLMAGKNVSVAPYVSDLTVGLQGRAVPEDFETMFQLINLYYTALNKDKQDFKSYISKRKALFANLLSKPQFYFINKMNKFIHGDSPRYTGFPSKEKLSNVNYGLAYKKYEQLTNNAAGLTFYFVGDIPVSKLKKYSEIYLASLPSSPKPIDYKTYQYRPLTGSHKKVVHQGKAAKSFVRLIWHGVTEYSPQTDYYMRSLGDILTMRLLDKLREAMSGVYSVSASGDLDKLPYGQYSFSIVFRTAPKHVENLIEAALAEVKNIIRNGPAQQELEKVKQQQLLSYKKKMKLNRYWLSNLVSADVNNTNKTAFLEFKSQVKSLTAEDIQQAAKKFLSGGHITGILYPEDYKQDNK